ncbi:MAG: hypothetical protein ABJQ29_05950 [Luteolibacter sp.]
MIAELTITIPASPSTPNTFDSFALRVCMLILFANVKSERIEVDRRDDDRKTTGAEWRLLSTRLFGAGIEEGVR